MAYWKKAICLAVLSAFGAMGSGCALFVVAGAGATAAVGTAEYMGGELKQAYAAPLEKTWNASLAAVEELRLVSQQKYYDNEDKSRVIKGKTREGKDFQISLASMAKDVTMVKVRIGVFGDEDVSGKIQDAISGNLKKL